jgi:hypothetical protein
MRRGLGLIAPIPRVFYRYCQRLCLVTQALPAIAAVERSVRRANFMIDVERVRWTSVLGCPIRLDSGSIPRQWRSLGQTHLIGHQFRHTSAGLIPASGHF